MKQIWPKLILIDNKTFNVSVSYICNVRQTPIRPYLTLFIDISISVGPY